MNERLVGLKTGYLLFGISKMLRLSINLAHWSPDFLMVHVKFYLCSYATGQKKTLDRNIAAPAILGRRFLCAYFIRQFAYSHGGKVRGPYYYERSV
jgi:hypothetical protein